MALPVEYPKIIDKTLPAGIVLSLVPGDPNFEIMLSRAPQSAGLPNTGAEVDIGRYPPVPASGAYVVDPLPVDGTVYYYRVRHVRAGWTDGPRSPWTRASKAAALAQSPTVLTPIPSTLADTVVTPPTLDPHVIVPDGVDIVRNGDIEQGFANWIGVTSTTINFPPYLNDPTTNLRKNTATPFAGAQSLTFTATNDATGRGIIAVDRGADELSSANPLLVRVTPEDQLYFRVSLKASVGRIVTISLACWDKDLTFISSLIGSGISGTPNVTTSWATYDSTVIVADAPGTFYVTPFLFCDGSANADIHVDNVHVWQQTLSRDLAVPLTLLVP